MSYLTLIDGDSKELVGYRVTTKEGVFDISDTFFQEHTNGDVITKLLARNKLHNNSTLSLVLDLGVYGTRVEHLTKNYIECVDDNIEKIALVLSVLTYDVFTLDDISWHGNTLSIVTRRLSFENNAFTVNEATHTISNVSSVTGKSLRFTSLQLRGKFIILCVDETVEPDCQRATTKAKYEIAVSLQESSFIRFNIICSEDKSRIALAVVENVACVLDIFTFTVLRRVLKVRNVLDTLECILDTEIGRLYILSSRKLYNNGDKINDIVLATVLFNSEKEKASCLLATNVVYTVQDFNIFTQECDYGTFKMEGLQNLKVSKHIGKSEILKIYSRK